MKVLQIIQQPTIDVTMSTLNQSVKKSKCMMVPSLEISDYEESDFLHLQPMLSIDNLPISSDNIPTQVDISSFEEFNNLTIPNVEPEVGLLIGNVNP